MRSTRVAFTCCTLALALALAGEVGIASGCGGIKNKQDAPPSSADTAPEPFGGTGTPGGSDDASIAVALRGSPLCGAVAGNCMPDDDGTGTLPYAFTPCNAAVEVDPDSGAALTPVADSSAADASTTGTGCRVYPSAHASRDGAYAPLCVGNIPDGGVDGIACTRGADCSRGYDCIVGDTGGVCRHYCCSGSCESHMSKNASATFCDIQNLIDRNGSAVPVCMPIKKCQLLAPGECGDSETCAVVTETGDTGCVAVGAVGAGAPCDDAHCAAGLTCLGNPGDRTCYKLCSTNGSECGDTQTCTTGTVFQDTTYGVCKDPSH